MRLTFLISWLLTDTVLQTGTAFLIQTQQTVLAAVGEDAPLSCLLLETKDVQQVIWQKVFGNKERNIGSYSEYFGQTVNPDFKDKVQFTEAGLQKTSIVIRSVTEQDEGCYLCLFNTFPDGAQTAGTCLKVYELHGPVLDVSRSSSPAGSVVSCSATGRPAPTVTLTAPQQNLSLSLYNTTRVSNSNGTVTVTTTALLSASSSTQVGCSVSVLSAAPRELLLTVPGPSHTSDHELCLITGLVGMLCVAVAAVAFIPVLFRKKAENRNPRSLDGVSDSLDSCLKDLAGKKHSPSDDATVYHTKPACGDSGEENSPLTERNHRCLDEELDPQQSLAIDELIETLPSGETHRQSQDTPNLTLVEELPVVPVTINLHTVGDCRRRISQKVKAALRSNFDQSNHDENKLTHQSVVEEMKQSILRSKVEGQYIYYFVFLCVVFVFML
ncbi:uncharacterized protein V3H82_024180 isoform 3-T3 [Fundulus diaphanus]